MENWQLPEGWVWKKLSDLVTVNYGKGLASRQRQGGDVPVYGANGVVGHHNVPLSRGKTIVVGRKGSAGAVNFSHKACWPIDTTFFVDDYPEFLGPEYLYHFLRSRPIAELQQSAAIPGLNRDVLYSVEIPIPYPDNPAGSLAEQRRIVARMETLLGEVREIRVLQAEIEADAGRLMDSVIQDVFDQPNAHWQTSVLTETAFIQTGTAKGRHFGGRRTIELPYLRVANVQAGYLDLDEIKTITIAEDEIDRYRLQPGDLLLTEGGDYDKLGRGAVWEGQIVSCIHQNHIFAVRFDPGVVLPKFAEYEMQSWHAKSYFLSVAKKTTNLATINKTKLGNFPLRYPSLAEQQTIVARLDAARAEIAAMQKLQSQDTGLVEQLEQAILAQAFRGEI